MEPPFKPKRKYTWIDGSLTVLEWVLSILCVLAGGITFASSDRIHGTCLIITGGVLLPPTCCPQWLNELDGKSTPLEDADEMLRQSSGVRFAYASNDAALRA
ncbi:hypothetical protein H6F89_30110 [Cyanobacteria bacterium FACHB-63]|nr:hypothetical protein [Cyanobacteria bacterium FACHB-63]